MGFIKIFLALRPTHRKSCCVVNVANVDRRILICGVQSLIEGTEPSNVGAESLIVGAKF